jgi:hypothetical protein
MKLCTWWRHLKETVLPARELQMINSDELPVCLPRRNLVLASKDGEQWCVGMTCPCGCKQRIELPLLREVKPRWELRLDKRGKPTLTPSVWIREGCCSHFYVRNGRVIWV